MNDPQLKFDLGDIVVHIHPDGSEGDYGTVTGISPKFINVLFEEDAHEKRMLPYQLKITYKKQNANN